MIPESFRPPPLAPAMPLPEPDAYALAHSERLVQHIRDQIGANGGWIAFARYVELALYAPGLGYYMAGARKLGREGDFVTAPEISPLFGETLARQGAQVLGAGLEDVPEIGAARASHRMERVAWLNRLPPSFSGVVLGNEVLDAMPVHIVRVTETLIEESGVESVDGEAFRWAWRPAAGELLEAAGELELPPGYTTEIALVARGFVRSLAQALERGVSMFIDYGFPRHEYFHPQRATGTLMCHYRHHAHDDPFFLPGLQDITSHVDFSAIADVGVGGGMALLGYTTQAAC